MVVGHSGCGGVQAVAERRSAGLVDNWLRHVADVAFKHMARLDRNGDKVELGRRLVELNVVEQVANVCRTTILREAWFRGQQVEVHGLVYGLADGLLRPLGVSVDGTQHWEERHEASIQTLASMNGNG
jgi:carbonic anhydrase